VIVFLNPGEIQVGRKPALAADEHFAQASTSLEVYRSPPQNGAKRGGQPGKLKPPRWLTPLITVSPNLEEVSLYGDSSETSVGTPASSLRTYSPLLA
jgi:hypothetical protein